MKPITENEEFKKAEALNYNKNEDKQLENYHSQFAKGAEWTQQFLQKEHEAEVLDWEHWQLENVKSIHRISGIEYVLTKGRGKVSFKEAFQLFRERDGK